MKCKRLIIALFLTIPFLLAGCNTAAGFGQDLQAGGKSIQKAAEKA